MLRALVTDGVTVGRWCCSATRKQLAELANLPPDSQIAPCYRPLRKVNDRYCPEHLEKLGARCQVQPCTRKAVKGKLTCNLARHIKYMAEYKERVEGNSSGMMDLLN